MTEDMNGQHYVVWGFGSPREVIASQQRNRNDFYREKYKVDGIV